ncbi:MAG: histidinol-phosphate transaminase [Actinomycetota bacterium]|nr:histidinol-phosphate transaminase [Actinomycetota bacterium]
MPYFRPDIKALNPYEVGRPIEDVAREHGIDPASIIKLAANESPDGPFPGVAEAVSAMLAESNRYPDNDLWDLSTALATELGVDRTNLLFGNGSVAIIADLTNAVGGPGTNIVYGWPSFVMYRYAAIWSGTELREVPLADGFVLDLDAIGEAVDENTRLVILCNPNNPTGTLTPSADIEAFIETLPSSTIAVVDEAYFEYVEDSRYRTAIPLAVAGPRVVVVRTFSKIFGLAAHRIGYAVGHWDTLTEVRKAQQPFTVSQPAQVAALATLGQPEELRRRVEANSAARHYLTGVIEERGLPFAESHTNFIFFRPGEDSREVSTAFTERGVIVRPTSGGWIRVTVGSAEENQRFVAVLDQVIESITD